jgi:hypothetical protein
MLEQTINIRAGGIKTGFYIKKLRIFLLSLCAVFLTACLPVGDQNINTELFKNKEDMKIRADQMDRGLSKKQTFEKIGVACEKFERMSTQEVQMSLYGNSQVQGTPEQLEQFKQRLLGYEGYALPYRKVESSGSLGFGTMKVNKTGYDLKLVLIFDRDRLLRAAVEGTQEVNQTDDQYLWNALLKKGIGIGF